MPYETVFSVAFAVDDRGKASTAGAVGGPQRARAVELAERASKRGQMTEMLLLINVPE